MSPKPSKEASIQWNSLPEETIVQTANNLWVIRFGVVVNRPQRKKCFEDPSLLLSHYHGDGNSILGYSLSLKKDFPHHLASEAYLSLFSNVEAKHKDPKVVYKDQKVHLYRFNNTKEPSYWLLLRTKIGS